MTIEEILEKLRYRDDVFPREALLEAMGRRDEITPALLGIIEDFTGDAEPTSEGAKPTSEGEREYVAHIYAMYLLAWFREKRAYGPLIRLLSTPKDRIRDTTKHVLIEGVERVLVSLYDGDLESIGRLVENEEANRFARGSAMEALVLLVAVGLETRTRIIGYLKELFNGKLHWEDPEDWEERSFLWALLVGVSMDLYSEELYEDIKKAFEDGRVDTSLVNMNSVNGWFQEDKEKVLGELMDRGSLFLVDDVVGEMERLMEYAEPDYLETLSKCFGMGLDDDDDDDDDDEDEDEWGFGPKRALSSLRSSFLDAGTPYVRETEKIGRNDPCPCGSGKKYKKCCL